MNDKTVNKGKIKHFRDLEIWKRGIRLVEEIYKITKDFPAEEKFGLTTQIRRAAVSIPSNIAEGFGRFHNSEYRQFLFIAIGSCAEVTTQLTIAQKLGYAKLQTARGLMDETEQISKMTMALIKKLK